MQLGVGRLARGWRGLIRCGGLIGIDGSAHISIQGGFVFGKRVSIGRHSIIQIPRDSTLRLGERVYIGREVELTPASEGEITIGNFTTVQDRCNFQGHITIGAHCLFAANVLMSSGTHHYMERPSWLIRDQDELVGARGYDPADARNLPINVADDCWIGTNCVVMRGVSLGRGCVVGANSVVTKSVPPYCVVAGAPAHLISQRLDFRPRREILASNPDDHPYFYSGFDLRQCAVSAYPQGLRASGKFQAALDCGSSRTVTLDIESKGRAILKYFRQRHSLHRGFQRVSISLENVPDSGLIEMEVSDADGSPCAVSVRRICVED
jgi:acetyltransferase-like isoleucine patch superfamily enzyme